MKSTISATTITMALCVLALASAAATKESSIYLRGGRSNNNNHNYSRNLRSEENRIGSRSSGGGGDSTSNTLVVPASLEPQNDDPCSVHVQLTCPTEVPLLTLGNNNCEGPFQTMTFRYNGGDCSQSDNLQQRHDFTCTDFSSSSIDNTSSSSSSSSTPTVEGGTEQQQYIVVTSRTNKDEEIYFSGPVSVGDTYTLNENEDVDTPDGDLTITVYDSLEGGNVLQTTDVLLDCSNPLFLFDRFGSSQVVSWKEADTGRVVSSSINNTNDTIEGVVGVTVDNRDSTKPIRLVEMTMLTNIQDEPINYTDNVKDHELQPGGEFKLPGFEFTYQVGFPKTRYTFFTTVIAEPLNQQPLEGDTNTIAFNNADGSLPQRICHNNAQIECIL